MQTLPQALQQEQQLQTELPLQQQGVFLWGDHQFASEHVAEDGHCGFTALGISRTNAINAIRNAPAHMRNEVARLMQPEIQAYLLTLMGADQEIPTDLPVSLRHILGTHNHPSLNGGSFTYAEIVDYVVYTYETHQQYLGYQMAGDPDSAFSQGAGMLVALAHLHNLEVHVFRSSVLSSMQLTQQLHFRPTMTANTLLNHTGNHFNLLREATGEDSDQNQSQHEDPHALGGESRKTLLSNLRNIKKSLGIFLEDRTERFLSGIPVEKLKAISQEKREEISKSPFEKYLT